MKKIKIIEDFRIPGTEIILEKDDKIKILTEDKITIEVSPYVDEDDDSKHYIDKFIKDMAKKYHVTGKVMNYYSNVVDGPIVRFTGSTKDLTNFLDDEMPSEDIEDVTV